MIVRVPHRLDCALDLVLSDLWLDRSRPVDEFVLVKDPRDDFNDQWALDLIDLCAEGRTWRVEFGEHAPIYDAVGSSGSFTRDGDVWFVAGRLGAGYPSTQLLSLYPALESSVPWSRKVVVLAGERASFGDSSERFAIERIVECLKLLHVAGYREVELVGEANDKDFLEKIDQVYAPFEAGCKVCVVDGLSDALFGCRSSAVVLAYPSGIARVSRAVGCRVVTMLGSKPNRGWSGVDDHVRRVCEEALWSSR